MRLEDKGKKERLEEFPEKGKKKGIMSDSFYSVYV